VGDPDLGACLTEVVDGWSFPEPADGDPTSVRCSFHFDAR
jgi:hypothetical protein